MSDALKEAAKMRRDYGWPTFLIKFRDYYYYTFDPNLFPEFEVVGEVDADGELKFGDKW